MVSTTQPWPSPESATGFSAKQVTGTGERFLYAVDEDQDGGYELVRFSELEAGWHSLVVERGSTLDGLLANNRLLCEVRTDEVWSYHVEDDDLDRVVARLRVVDAGPPPQTGDGDAARLDELIVVPQGRLLEPRCEVNEHPLVAFAFEQADGPWVAAVYDFYDERLRPVDTIAESSWFSESGGAPVSWDGGNSLGLLAGELLLESQRGDHGFGFEVRRPQETPSDLTAEVVSWVGSIDASLSAALHLEPLKLPLSSTPDEIAVWEERFELELSFSLDLRPEQIDAVRNRLRRDDATYRAVAQALADPDSAAGRRLATAMDQVLQDGVLEALQTAIDG